MRNSWQDLIDEKVKEAIGDGDISHLPGAGLPLNLDDDEYTPRELRLAYKIMTDHDVMPGWIMMGRDLDEAREKLLARLERFAKDYDGRVQDAYRSGSAVRLKNAEDRREAACERLRRDTAKYNSKLLEYNLTIPPQIQQKIPLDIEKEIKHVFNSYSL